MRSTLTLLLCLTTLLRTFAQECTRGNFQYSAATYTSEFHEKTGSQLDSLLKASIAEYFCENQIKDLPTKSNDKRNRVIPSESHVIEPLFIDLETFNGIYAKRIWPIDPKVRIPTRFTCGFQHFLFIIANDKYIELTGNEAENAKLIQKHLSPHFNRADISHMINEFKRRVICDQHTFLPPCLVKRGERVEFDIESISNKENN